MLVTLSGIVTEERREQLVKPLAPIEVTPFDIVTDDIAFAPENTFAPKLVTALVISTDAMLRTLLTFETTSPDVSSEDPLAGISTVVPPVNVINALYEGP